MGLHWGVCRPISSSSSSTSGSSSGSSSSGSGVTRARDDSSPVARCYQLPLPLPLRCPQKQRTAALATTRETECHAAHRLSWPKQLDNTLYYPMRCAMCSCPAPRHSLTCAGDCATYSHTTQQTSLSLSLTHTHTHTLTHSLSCNGILLCYVQQSNY